MFRHSNFTTPYKYVHEAIWIPTYVVVAIIVLGTIQNSSVATVVMIVGLIACRMFLEVFYRVAFGDVRLTVRIGLLAFMSQLAILGGVLGWYLHNLQNS